jgi:nucleotide-binding universal stress UspA family protein
MARFSKIIVAVDGSAGSLHTLKEALTLGAERLTAVSVVPGFGPRRGQGEEPPASLRRPYERALTAAREMAKEAGVELETILAVGEPYRGIVEQAEARDADVVVIGLKGPELPEEAMMGSTTARVIGYSPRDILVVGPDARVAFARILLATDGSRYSRRALAKALEVARAYGGALQVVSALDVPPGFAAEAPEVTAELLAGLHRQVEEARNRAEGLGIECQGWVRQGPAHQVITGLARAGRIDLIVMGSHGRTGLKRLLMGSVAERVIGRAPCPVLVVKSGAAADLEC